MEEKTIDLNIMSDLLSRRQVAKKLGVHPETVKRYQKRGILPAFKMNSKNTRYDPRDVEKLLQERMIG